MVNHPLRLATGSHAAGAGKGCAMNVISWESGDSTISDMPPCADPLLARVVQRVNDVYCAHTVDGMLCPPCSVEVLALAHRTVGTALDDWTGDARRRLYVRLALDEAESVAHLSTVPEVARLRVVVAAWLAGKATVEQVEQARKAASAASAAADAAAYAAYAAYAAATADAAAYAAYATDADRMRRAHALIDRFGALTGRTATPVPGTSTEHAIDQMLARA